MHHAQGPWLLGLFSGLLVAAIIALALTQWPQAMAATANKTALATPAPDGLERVACVQAAIHSQSCFANGTFRENSTFRIGNQTYICGCNLPKFNNSPLPSITAWPEPTANAMDSSLNGTEPSETNASWLYILSGYDQPGLVQKIVDAKADGLVVDAFEAAPDVAFTQEQVGAFKKSHPVVLAYLSIGEAEDYRYYWKPEWKNSPPAWLAKANPNWQGNAKVRYWDPAWQAIVFGYLDRIVDAGFGGAYLDIVDGYEYWSDPLNGESEVLSRDDAAKRMIVFIKAIRDHARAKNPHFLVFPQNAQELAQYPGYLDVIDGIGREDTWYVGFDDRRASDSYAVEQNPSALEEQVSGLAKIRQAGKTVLVVDYFSPQQRSQAADFAQKARNLGFYPYAADTRKLNDRSSLWKAGQVQTQIVAAPGPGMIQGFETRSDYAVR